MILAIDGSSLVASVALANHDKVIAEYSTNQKKTHSQTLLPMIDEIMKATDTDKKEIEAVAVSKGPGSFTGLRIASATAKGISLALNIPVVAVPTLESLAYNFCTSTQIICPIMDARRNQVYTGIYRFDGMEPIIIKEQTPMDIRDLLNELRKIGETVIFLGDGVPVYKGIIEDEFEIPHIFAPNHMSRQRAASVAVLAYRYIEEGKVQTSDEHVPEYLRVSQAERERMERDSKNDE